MTLPRLMLLSLAALAQAGCARPEEIDAYMHGASTALQIVAERKGSDDPLCIARVEVAEYSDTAVNPPMWTLRREDATVCRSTFTYGRAPAGFRQSGPAPRLQAGRTYLLDVSGSGVTGGQLFPMWRDDDPVMVF